MRRPWRGRDFAATAAAGGAADAGLTRAWLRNSFDDEVRRRRAPTECQPRTDRRRCAVRVHRAAGTLPGPRPRFLRSLHRAPVPLVHWARTRPEDTRLSRQARLGRIRDADHARRAASRAAV